jgi:hypothetical protein
LMYCWSVWCLLYRPSSSRLSRGTVFGLLVLALSGLACSKWVLLSDWSYTYPVSTRHHASLRGADRRRLCGQSPGAYPNGAEISMSLNAANDQKHNEATKPPESPPAGAQHAFCPRDNCHKQLTVRGTVTDGGTAILGYQCPCHGTISHPEYAGGKR